MQTAATDPIKQGITQYTQDKPEGDIDLVDEVRQLLIGSGLQSKLPFYDNNRFIKEAEGKHSQAQRYLLNRYWTHQLSLAPVVSIEERYCLIPDGDIGQWLNLFRAKVLPFVIQFNLPVAF